jgi:rhodanese-related sulfurtransferase/DNA-directed RNA polymerase subunit RPC12/RpoP
MKLKISLFLFFSIVSAVCFGQKPNDVYVCVPCGNSCDAQEHASGGQCEHCSMPLVAKSTIKHTTVAPEKVCDFLASRKNLLLLDVRTREEFAGTSEENPGTLKNAINIPVDELESRLSELNAHKGKTILVFCSHSHRSPRASYLLTQNGFKNVVNMSGGMSVMHDERCKK